MPIHKCKLIDLPKIYDPRGSLTFIESTHVDFEIKRVYYLYDVPGGESRGAHAHLDLHQVLIPLTGSFEVELDDGFIKKSFFMKSANQGLYISPMIWRDLRGFTTGSVCLALASQIYDECDYIRSYDTFLRMVS